jgi:hypothetical protein
MVGIGRYRNYGAFANYHMMLPYFKEVAILLEIRVNSDKTSVRHDTYSFRKIIGTTQGLIPPKTLQEATAQAIGC